MHKALGKTKEQSPLGVIKYIPLWNNPYIDESYAIIQSVLHCMVLV